MSALQRKLATAKLAAHKTDTHTYEKGSWRGGRLWEQAPRDLAAGTFKTALPRRFPVILTPDGPVSSWDEVEIGRMTIGHISYEEGKKLWEKVEVVRDSMSSNHLVRFNGIARALIIVKALKDGVTLDSFERREDDAVGKSAGI
ncbi:hypothetical protein N0V88_007163 [Collariella sp. IMI 366227]|nr:hypothetical protein N0V88_007163 [Collariella sp. IMI 366227]